MELERLGGPALPALRAARASRDMEIKTRAVGLVSRIETALLTQPTSVRLDFDGATLSEVAQSITRQTGCKSAYIRRTYPDGRTSAHAAALSGSQFLEGH